MLKTLEALRVLIAVILFITTDEESRFLPLVTAFCSDNDKTNYNALDYLIRKEIIMADLKDKRIVIIGAGMAGELCAIRFQEMGFNNFQVYEKGADLGGTWRENTYPGLTCDVPSHLYSYSFSPNPDWSHVFSPGPEIHRYFKNVADKFGIEKYIQYNSEITELNFEGSKWKIKGKNVSDEADFVIAATGVLHHPKYPDIEGQDSFAGPIFHSARWDHRVDLTDKKVAVIGTGSSAVQIVGTITDICKDVFVFQRTPQWILNIENPEIPEEEREKYRKHPEEMIELRKKYSQAFSMYFADAVVDANSEQLQMLQKLCIENLETNVKDPVLREKLRPNYRAGCKRLVVSSTFYEAITKPQAHLITEKIVAIEKEGIRCADRNLIKVDVIVLATGFRVDAFLRPMKVFGINGKSLDGAWADCPTAYMSISVPNFPNLFMLNGPNGPVGNFSLIEVAELQFDYIMNLISHALESSKNIVMATEEALARHEAKRVEATKKTVWVTGCNSWYLDKRGVPMVWPFSFEKFREEMSKVRLEDYELAKV